MVQGFIICLALNSNIVFVHSTLMVKQTETAVVCQILGLKSRITVLVLEAGKEMWELEQLTFD